MELTGLQIAYVLIYFVYGLAFFSMGLALALETGRAPLLAERRVLIPLAIFGILHGIHEWLEIILLQGVWMEQPFQEGLDWVRVTLLVISFYPLIVFGTLLLDRPARIPDRHALWIGVLSVYCASLFLSTTWHSYDTILHADILARYLLAVPGGLLAGAALRRRAQEMRHNRQDFLAAKFQWAAFGFTIYGLTQVFVPPADIFPSPYVNSTVFMELTGVPIQLVRAGMAIMITINLIQTIRQADRQREEDLLAAQIDRLAALEQIGKELAAREKMRKDLLRHIVQAQEEERARIARELHDDTAQILTGFSLHLATLKNSLPPDRQVLDQVSRLQVLSGRMSESIYRMVRDLRPAQLDDLGLVPALQYLSDEFTNRTGLEVSIKVSGARRRLDPIIETVIFRVVQEALSNVHRHAGVNQASACISFLPESVNVVIQDAGVGFNPDEDLAPPRGWGLAGMRERVESVGGWLEIRSKRGHGTAVEATLPVEAAREETAAQKHPGVKD